MTVRRFAAASLLAATALVAATPASAQRVTRIVAFGDSYADTGNLFRIGGINPISTVVYTTGRFSGGTNYIDTLSTLLNAPQVNFAIGGATTGFANVTTSAPLGFQTEVASFLAGGGTLFPATTPKFGPNDLLALSVGGNDANGYQGAGGTVAGAAAAANVSVANFTSGVNALVGAGARNISYIALQPETAPRVAGDPAAQQVLRAFSSTFNAGIQAPLAGYAANGAIVNYLDVGLVGARITATPAAYGITNLVCPAFPNPTCVVNASGYLFYGDQLHLTSDGFRIVAKYVAAQMEAPLTLQATSDLALDTARQFGRTMTARMDAGSPRDGELLSGVRLFAMGDTFSRTADATFTSDQIKIGRAHV